MTQNEEAMTPFTLSGRYEVATEDLIFLMINDSSPQHRMFYVKNRHTTSYLVSTVFLKPGRPGKLNFGAADHYSVHDKLPGPIISAWRRMRAGTVVDANLTLHNIVKIMTMLGMSPNIGVLVRAFYGEGWADGC